MKTSAFFILIGVLWMNVSAQAPQAFERVILHLPPCKGFGSYGVIPAVRERFPLVQGLSVRKADGN